MTQSSNPFDNLERLFDQMERNFEEAAQWWEKEGASRGLPGTRSVRVDIEDAGEELVLTADLPGFERADIDLRVTDRTLRLEADHEETAEETEEEDEREFVHRERHRASVSRTVQLPESVETGEISATYANGVLTVRMPKSEPLAEGTEIDIECPHRPDPRVRSGQRPDEPESGQRIPESTPATVRWLTRSVVTVYR